MVRKEFAEEKPMTVAKVLAGWLRAVTFIMADANKEEVLDSMSAFFEKNNVKIPRSSLELDLKLVELFDLEQQLNLMERRGSPPTSTYDIWTNEVANFLESNGVIKSVPDPSTFIDDKYMKMIKSDKQLEDWALGKELAASGSTMISSSNFVMVTSIVLLVFATFHYYDA